MKIEIFLSKKQEKKYSILKKLLSLPDYQLSQNELMNNLNMSYGTVTQLFTEINQDISSANLENDIQLVQGRNYGQKYYALEINRIVAIDHLLLYYLNESIPFLILKDTLLGNSGTIDDTTKKYFISKSTLRREVGTMNKQLAPYGVSISIQKKMALKGNEWALRLFAASFLAQSYGSKEWIFKFISLEDTQKYLSIVASQFIDTYDLKNDISALYLVAVSFFRVGLTDKEFTTTKKELLYSEDTPDFKVFLDEGFKFLRSLKPQIAREELIFENQAIFTLLLLNNNFPEIKKIPYFFYQDTIFQDDPLFKINYYLITQFDVLLPEPLLIKEHINVSYQFSLIAYRHLLLNQVYPTSHISVLKKDQSDTEKVHEIVSNFVDSSQHSLSTDQLELLKVEYTQTLITYIDWVRYKPTINIYLVSDQSTEELNEEVLKTNPQFNFNINIYKKMPDQLSLVVSDVASTENILDVPSSVPIFYWESLSSSNTGRFYEELSQISEEKCDW